MNGAKKQQTIKFLTTWICISADLDMENLKIWSMADLMGMSVHKMVH